MRLLVSLIFPSNLFKQSIQELAGVYFRFDVCGLSLLWCVFKNERIVGALTIFMTLMHQVEI